MSFELYVSTFRDEEFFYFPAVHIRMHFSPIIVGQRHGSWCLGFDEGRSFGEIPMADGPLEHGFSVRRPPDHPVFWTIIARFLVEFGAVLYWPGGGMVVARANIVPHLPKSMVEGLGEPWITTDPERIRHYIRETS